MKSYGRLGTCAHPPPCQGTFVSEIPIYLSGLAELCGLGVYSFEGWGSPVCLVRQRYRERG
jgi:hypothetical protein